MNALSLFNDWLDSDDYFSAASNTCFSTPSVDVKETKDAYVLDMDLPGRDEKEINIELNEKILTISSVRNKDENKAEMNTENKSEISSHFLLRERRRADFERRFSLPEDIDSDNVSATFNNGVLSIRIARKAKEEPKRIQIQVA